MITWRNIVKAGVVFLATLVFYIGFYGCDSHLRSRKGPWQLAFSINETGDPVVSIHQPALGITNATLVFPGGSVTRTNDLPQIVVFDEPLKTIPFGEFFYHDLMYLPGAAAFRFFGHEIELLPRTLRVDRQEIPWASDLRMELPAQSSAASSPSESAQTVGPE